MRESDVLKKFKKFRKFKKLESLNNSSPVQFLGSSNSS